MSDLVSALVNLAKSDLIEKPRGAKNLGLLMGFLAQRKNLEQGFYFTREGKKIEFEVRGYNIFFPSENDGEEEKVFYLIIWGAKKYRYI